MKSPILCAAVSLFLFVLLSGCSKTSITDTWKDTSFQAAPINSVLVLAVAKDQLARRNYEETFVKALSERGVKAYPSYRYAPSDPVKKREIQAAVRKLGAKYVLVTTLVGVEKETQYHPPRTYVAPRMGMGYYGYYYRSYEIVHEPGFYSTNVKVQLETALYDVANQKQIWIAHSQTMNPNSASDVIQSVIPELVDAMKEDGLIL